LANHKSFQNPRSSHRWLLEAQKGKCFICEKKLDPDLHGSQLDIDHVK
jgi:hypothetical protein